MTWVSIKMFFEKSLAWCIQHWRWLVFTAIGLIAYLAGRKSAKSLWMKADLARDHYKAEAAAIEKAQLDKSKKIQQIEKEFKDDITKIENKKDTQEKSLEDAKKSDILTLSKNATEIDESLKDMGIEEI